MFFLYNIVIVAMGYVLKILALFRPKIRLLVNGQKQTIAQLQKIKKNDQVLWFHCASLGEFEQGRPLMEKIKKEYPKYKIVLTFFSPSGYEVQKDYKWADVVCYLPLDTRKNAIQFLKKVHPKWAFFIKYEFWPNLLHELKKQKINTALISANFTENQVFFKYYGGWMRKQLAAFTLFFVQNQTSKILLESINYKNSIISGDTRFDRVFEITQQNNHLPFIESFVSNSTVLVAGSTWKDDEKVLIKYINEKAKENQKFIIAPHNINAEDCKALQNAIIKKSVLFSEKESKNLKDFQVFIIDTIGILTKVYSYADIAYVGGGYTKPGIHNILEPATFAVPIIIGPIYQQFNEAVDLVAAKGCIATTNFKNFSISLEQLFLDEKFKRETGNICSLYVKQKKGATNIILNHIPL